MKIFRKLFVRSGLAFKAKRFSKELAIVSFDRDHRVLKAQEDKGRDFKSR